MSTCVSNPPSVLSNLPLTGGRPARKDPQAPNTTSPTLITLLVQARQQFFTRSPSEAFEVAGFGRSKEFVGTAFVSKDTGETIAEPKWNGFDAAMGQLSQIEIRCDPARCVVEFDAGQRLISALRVLANQLDGYIADGVGSELSEDELSAVGQHIDALLDQRASEQAPKGFQVDAQTIRFPGQLSFQYVDHVAVPKKRSKKVHPTFFESHDTDFFEGRAEGVRRAMELVQFILDHKVRSPSFAATLNEIFTSGQWAKSYQPGGHIAGAFIETIEEVFRAGCVHISKGWMLGRHQYLLKQAKLNRETKAEEASAFVERMRAAKAAKKAARQGEAV